MTEDVIDAKIDVKIETTIKTNKTEMKRKCYK